VASPSNNDFTRSNARLFIWADQERLARVAPGLADAVVVTTPQAVWVADPIQNIQLLFLHNCVDPVSTRMQLQNALEWLDGSGEAEALADRSAK
jgi:hypothetical protein